MSCGQMLCSIFSIWLALIKTAGLYCDIFPLSYWAHLMLFRRPVLTPPGMNRVITTPPVKASEKYYINYQPEYK